MNNSLMPARWQQALTDRETEALVIPSGVSSQTFQCRDGRDQA
jgi:hypothetical protein